MRIYVSGSLAFDRIMTFPGRFADHILPDKIHILNVCFLVNGLEERFGGTAGNIVYTLALLGERPTLLASAGKDFDSYAQWLENLGLDLSGVKRVEDDFTAGAYITTDMSDNQITGFNPAAMNHRCGYAFSDLKPEASLAIVSPGNLEDMLGLPDFYRKQGVPYIFDPGQNTTAFSGEQLSGAIAGSRMLVTNDYELELIMESTGMDKAKLLEITGCLVTTLGEKGSRVVEPGKVTEIPVAPAAQVLDPTGAGDAYRAGMLKGMALGLSVPEACKLGAVTASFSVEQKGTQEHAFSMADQAFRSRYEQTFGDWAFS